ncbi:MAG TPA: hypothetical protein VMU19_01235 [Bryobacteraceae bacterium]|nr:hypothetical protein [Bryobacteraceae bacterium]
MQSILSSVMQSSGLSATAKKSQSTGALSGASQSDNTQLSPYAQITTELQQLQQSDPTKYSQVTGQIATNLQSAAKTAAADGNTTSASQLNQLATDFQNASSTGQLPNFQDLAQAAASHHHHHGHGGPPPSTDSSSSTDTDSLTANSSLSQILASFQTSTAQSESLNPMNIIMDTLSTAGVTGS